MTLRPLLISTACVVVCVACGAETLPINEFGERVIIQVRPDVASAAVTPLLTVEQAGVLASEKKVVRNAFPWLKVTDELNELPMLIVVGADTLTLEALRAHPLVVDAWPETLSETQDLESFRLIQQPAALDAGFSGNGASVAVLDTGLDYRSSEFGTCSAPGAAGCAVAFVRDFAPDDAALDANGHGTNVAGIVRGMAPRARVIGLDVFNGSGASSADIISAMNWVIANRATYNIVAMNLSLGGGRSTTTCPTDVFATPVASARAAGVLSVIASGNNASTTAISSPACAPEAISVGAVYDSAGTGLQSSVCTDRSSASDQVACFSNSAAFLSLVAPGTFVTAAGITMTGTSQATPHVAGAVALLASRFPNDTASTRASRLLSGATMVRDARNGITRPRLTLGAGFGACSIGLDKTLVSFPAGGGAGVITVRPSATNCTWSVTGLPTWVSSSISGQALTLTASANTTTTTRTATAQLAGVTFQLSQAADVTPPTGTVTAPRFTRTTSVAVTLSATDPSGVTSMCLSTGTTCTTFVAYTTSATVTAPAGDGVKTISAWFRDARGNTTAAAVKATTTLDATAPTNGALTGTAAAGTLTLRWSGFADPTSGLASYKLVRSTSSTTDAPASCSSGTVVSTGTALTASLSVASKTTARFRVCATDTAGNVSTGATLTFTMP
jgi:subtilisin family serine protease